MSRMQNIQKNNKQKAYISYKSLWESENDIIISKKDKNQDINQIN